MKKLLIPAITAVLVISACNNFFTFDNSDDPKADNFAGIVRMDGVESIEIRREGGLLLLVEGTVYEYTYDGNCSAVSGLPSGITAVSGAGDHSLALDSKSRVWAWGDNYNGQLGIDTDNKYGDNKPVVVNGVEIPATFIRSKTDKSAAGTGTETTYIWGNFGTENIPLQYDTPTAMSWGIVKDIAIGDTNLLILTEDGKVFIWNAELTAPAAVSGLSDITAVSASDHYLAMDISGMVWAWGENNYGQLGDGTTTDRTTPAIVPGLTGVTVLVAASEHSLALTDTAIYAWGRNHSGNTGKIWNSIFRKPVAMGNGGKIGGATPILFLANDSKTFVYTDAGYLYGFGEYLECPLCGYQDGCITELSVFALDNTEAAVACSIGYRDDWDGHREGNFDMMLMNDGSLYGFGDNNAGQMGNGTIGWVSTPEDTGLSEFKAIAVGGGHVIAVETGGNVKAWGRGSQGQLGDGTSTDSLVPVDVPGLSGIISVAAGYRFSLACKDDGTVWGWGNSDDGQIGASSLNTAAVISGLSGITAVAAGSSHSIVLKNDGTVWALGANASGQLGNGTTVNSNVPVQVSGLTGITAIAASNDISAALKNDGTVWAWGKSGGNALSQGSAFIDFTAVPFQINGVTTAGALAAGARTVLILLEDGSLLITGTTGYLTKDTNELYPGPYPLDSFAGITIEKIYGGYFGFMIIDDGGKAYCWQTDLN